MLLRYVVLFLNILVAARRLTPGWSIQEGGYNRNGGPKRGGLYWLTPTKLQMKDEELRAAKGRRVACVVLYVSWVDYDLYSIHVATIFKAEDKTEEGLPATDFFEDGTIIQTHHYPSRLTDFYRILPRPIYVVSGRSLEIQLYDDSLICMSLDAVGRLVVASGMVYGWYPGQNGPLLGGVYWIHPGVFGLKVKAGIYIPCVVIRWVGHNLFRVAGMSPSVRQNGYHVREFFGHANLYTGIPKIDLIDLKDHYIYPHKKYEIKGDPNTMQRWEGQYLLKMPDLGLVRLVAVSGMVDGWDAQRGGVYWIQPQYLGMNKEVGVYIPCVVICLVENKYHVVRMSILKRSNGRDAIEFFRNANLQTPTGITNFQKYYFHADNGYEVEGNPKIMQRWEEGDVTIMPEDEVKKLEKFVLTWKSTHGKSPHA